MNLKEKIIRSKISRLDPEGEASLIRKLEKELARQVKADPPAAPAPDDKELPADIGPRRPLTEANVEDFRALEAEVHIRSKKHGDIWLVPERTRAPRFEILPEEMRILSLAADRFNGRVVEVRRNVPA